MKTPAVIASATLVASIACNVTYADDAGLKRCANIGSPLERLECYDALARSIDLAPAKPPAARAPVAAPRVAANPAPAPTVAPAPAPVPEPVSTAPPQPTPAAGTTTQPADFGFEEKRMRESSDNLTARYDGEFSGWSGQTLFKLDNGQVWRQAQNGRVSYRRSRPLITIKKGAFGSYRLSVEGLNKTIRVKRVK
ncbi:MAG: hypothetical protein AB8G17_07620 [Gammaproteobacteria bacterium]